MAVGAFLEPLIVVSLLFGGAFFNRSKDYNLWEGRSNGWSGDGINKRTDDLNLMPKNRSSDDSDTLTNWSTSSTQTLAPHELSTMRRRKIQFLGFKRIVSTPNTLVFQDRFLSRLLQKFPFLAEAWYWALIYWVRQLPGFPLCCSLANAPSPLQVYQLGRAFTAVTIVEGTVHVARRHALQLIHLEQQLHVFWEVPFQEWFLARPGILHWTNRIYSFIHIPGTIFFLVALFYLTTTRKRRVLAGRVASDNVTAGPALYEARRRTMATCNLIAFVVFTLWPCMPPRLLSDPGYNGADAAEAKSFGFVDTVHSGTGESSVWTTNRFCNQYGEFRLILQGIRDSSGVADM